VAADIEQVDPADVMLLVGYFFKGPYFLERVYRKRGVTHAVTRATDDLPQVIWRYENVHGAILVKEVAWIDEEGLTHWWPHVEHHDPTPGEGHIVLGGVGT